METVLTALKKGEEFLKQKGVESPRLDSELLLSSVLSYSRVDLYLNFNKPLTEDELTRLRPLFKKRGERVPVQYILTRQEFRGLDFFVDERVLIPRPDTEILVEAVIEISKKKEKIKILDLCTGSGCIAVSLANEIKDVEVTAMDISADALKVACFNAEKHKKDIHFIEGNLFAPLEEQYDNYFDIIVSNPPYIPIDELLKLQPEVKEYEPEMALSAGSDGLRFIRQIIKESSKYMAPNGSLLMEIGFGQYEQVKKTADEIGGAYNAISVKKDYAGIERVVIL